MSDTLYGKQTLISTVISYSPQRHQLRFSTGGFSTTCILEVKMAFSLLNAA